MAARVRRRVVVRGTVQGVCFRDSCRREAEHRQVGGWVANRADGAVEAVFEGEEENVEAMVRWVHTGPPQALVSEVQVSDEPAAGESAFRVVSRG
jgi:acylphosphatase